MIPGTMIPYVLGLGVPELLIILAVVLLLFGGARLAGIGKSTGRAIKEFKEETKGLPIHFSLKWLKPPPVPPDGSMTLFEHLRELRYRLVVASLAIIAATILAAFFYQFLLELLTAPYRSGIDDLKENNPGAVTELVNINLTSPLKLAVQVCLVAGLVLSGPVWLYQLWAFIVPGLLAREKKWALIF